MAAENKIIALLQQAEPAAGERAAFEAWAIEQGINITPSYPRGGQRDYAYMEASYSWRIWQGISRYRAAQQQANQEAEFGERFANAPAVTVVTDNASYPNHGDPGALEQGEPT